MKKGLTELVFILDRSGSMRGLEKDTIGGFNSMIEKQKTEEGEAVVSTVIFDNVSEVIYDRADIQSISPLTEKQYFVRGCTALLDAVGGAIDHIRSIRKTLPKEERPEKTIFIITTDGLENASQQYTYAGVKQRIEKRQAKGWEFIFLGANIDAAAEAGRMGIKASRSATYTCDATGTELNYTVLTETVSKMRSCKDTAAMNAMMDQDLCLCSIREDHENRKDNSCSK